MRRREHRVRNQETNSFQILTYILFCEPVCQCALIDKREANSAPRLRGTERLFLKLLQTSVGCEKEGESFITEPEECIQLGQRQVGVRGDVQLVRSGSPCCSKAS